MFRRWFFYHLWWIISANFSFSSQRYTSIPFGKTTLLLIGLLCFPLVVFALGGVDDDTDIGFMWEPPTNAEAVFFYRIYVSVDGEPFDERAETIDTYYIVQGDSGHCYRLRVAGVNAQGEQGRLSPESDTVLCLPQENTPVLFEFAAAQAVESAGQLRLIWETNGYLYPSSFQVRRRDLSSSRDNLLDVEVLSDPNSSDDRYGYWCVDRNVEVGETYRYTIQAADPSGYGILAISICVQVKGPGDHRLFQNYPNPFNAQTTLSYQNPEIGRVVLTIFNAQGQKVRTLVDAIEVPGLHMVFWDGTDADGVPVASGVYFCHMWSGDFVALKKLTVLR